jgi:putative transposase
MDFPFAGSRMLRDLLAADGVKVGRLHVATLMKKMVIEAIYRRPNTSKPAPGHKVYPYLLRKLAVTRPNQEWATDITYIPMARGFVYLIAIVDWFSRRVLAWRLSITLETDFCIEALEEALARFGTPEIFNTDQGSQFTSMAFTSVLLRKKIAISMNGRGAWRDNVFVERLWRSVKYEEIYLQAYGLVSDARASLGRYLTFYNGRRPHSSLDRMTPDHVYFNQPLLAAARNRQPPHLAIARGCADKPSHLYRLMIEATHLKVHRTAVNLFKRGSTSMYRPHQRRDELEAARRHLRWSSLFRQSRGEVKLCREPINLGCHLRGNRLLRTHPAERRAISQDSEQRVP